MESEMKQHRATTAQEALEMIQNDKPPLNFGTSKPIYVSALKRLLKVQIPGEPRRPLQEIEISPRFVEGYFSRLEQVPLDSLKARKSRADWKTRLKRIAKELAAQPVQSPSWNALIEKLEEIEREDDLDDHELIPIRSTLKTIALEDGLDPHEMTAHWLQERLLNSTEKRRGSLIKAARQVDTLRSRLPVGLRPPEPFGAVGEATRLQRRSRPLPPLIAAELSQYREALISGTTVAGTYGQQVKIRDGIKPRSAINYDQALKWYLDSLYHAGYSVDDPNLTIADIARPDWFASVLVQSRTDYKEAHGSREPRSFPWSPVAPKTVNGHGTALRKMFLHFEPEFDKITIPAMSECNQTTLYAPDIVREVRKDVDTGMTPANRAFTDALIHDEQKRYLFLSLHLLAWDQAQKKWETFDQQNWIEQCKTINLCCVAAAFAILVYLPFRVGTLVKLQIYGDNPSVILPPKKPSMKFIVPVSAMKTQKAYDAEIDGDDMADARQIIDWFIGGPRKAILSRITFLSDHLKKPDLLFAGMYEKRIREALTPFTEEIGMRMKPHMVRHALATILLNNCNASIEDIAALLGNHPEVTMKTYANRNVVEIRGGTMRSLALERETLKARRPSANSKV